MELPKRKPTRLKGYDYSQSGAYFVTICTYKKQCTLGAIIVGQGLAPAEIKLSPCGKIAEEQLSELNNRYLTVKIEKYVIMPNHIHMIIRLDNAAGASPRPTISDVICAFKSMTTRLCNQFCDHEHQLFQSSFHDHIIRAEEDYLKIWQYIDTNPLKWELDCFYSKH